MARASTAVSRVRGRTFPDAILPPRNGAGGLLADYSLRLGAAVLRHRTEVAERASRVEAELASKVKSELIANISHELRTPLNSILGFSKLLRAAQGAPMQPDQIAEYAGFITDSAERLLAVVNDVITLSKLQSGKLQIAAETVHADELIEAAAAWARPRAANKHLNLIEKVEDGLPPISGAAEHLKNILLRLLGNAIKFTGEGGTVALIAKRAPGDRILIAVSDTGIGMSQKQIEVALKPFGQADTSLDRANEGAGLGLPIAKALAELHGGSLILTSRLQAGTDAVLLLPRGHAQVSAAAEAEASRPRSAAGGARP